MVKRVNKITGKLSGVVLCWGKVRHGISSPKPQKHSAMIRVSAMQACWNFPGNDLVSIENAQKAHTIKLMQKLKRKHSVDFQYTKPHIPAGESGRF